MPTISQTTVEKVQWVFPEHAGAPGQIHGGRMMEWIVEAGTLAAARLVRGNVALGAMDDIDFLHPVRVGEIAILRAQVEHVGRSSLEVGVRVWAEHVATGRRSVTLNSHLVFVSVDDDGRPRPVANRITPADAAEGALVEEARQRREVRLARFAHRRELTQRAKSGESRPRTTWNRPPSAISEQAAPAPTAPAPTTLESVRPVPWTGEVREACTAFLTFVHLGPDLRPRPCPPFTPRTPAEQRRWDTALGPREQRLQRIKRLKATIVNDSSGERG